MTKVLTGSEIIAETDSDDQTVISSIKQPESDEVSGLGTRSRSTLGTKNILERKMISKWYLCHLVRICRDYILGHKAEYLPSC